MITVYLLDPYEKPLDNCNLRFLPPPVESKVSDLTFKFDDHLNMTFGRYSE